MVGLCMCAGVTLTCAAGRLLHQRVSAHEQLTLLAQLQTSSHVHGQQRQRQGVPPLQHRTGQPVARLVLAAVEEQLGAAGHYVHATSQAAATASATARTCYQGQAGAAQDCREAMALRGSSKQA